jgi:hypothetical protein
MNNDIFELDAKIGEDCTRKKCTLNQLQPVALPKSVQPIALLCFDK